jgi:hypothetical protein
MHLLSLWACALALFFLGAGMAHGTQPDFAGAEAACKRLARNQETCVRVVQTAAKHYGQDHKAFKLWRNKSAEFKEVWFYIWRHAPPNY